MKMKPWAILAIESITTGINTYKSWHGGKERYLGGCMYFLQLYYMSIVKNLNTKESTSLRKKETANLFKFDKNEEEEEEDENDGDKVTLGPYIMRTKELPNANGQKLVKWLFEERDMEQVKKTIENWYFDVNFLTVKTQLYVKQRNKEGIFVTDKQLQCVKKIAAGQEEEKPEA
ncbi:hypothetical protein LXL04_038634 [Taraxacum kok-saghyz]